MQSDSADRILREAFDRVTIEGASTHSLADRAGASAGRSLRFPCFLTPGKFNFPARDELPAVPFVPLVPSQLSHTPSDESMQSKYPDNS
ncbi:hypothetical protein K4039_14900 [Lyngbya sp. CCAP 1446/10]|uniref:hypothetical protein n=1 Tax=Lyngbya sp. CCAP 1446/10 TaxID=439293 RepID=UPI002236FC49|nr:hypothetical protein [Lyngbya sp. CCAP 1446/10]MCW6051340.1 hypothetical protein [Lyngbya sp. CCAP 1446/10]